MTLFGTSGALIHPPCRILPVPPQTTASYFTEPLFDVIIHLKHIPFLEDEPTRVMHKIRCYHAMNKRVPRLPEGSVLHALSWQTRSYSVEQRLRNAV